MNPLTLHLPKGAVIVGEILRNYADVPYRLNEDLLQVRLPSGVVVDVGWFPTADPKGSFRITVFRGEWDNWLFKPIDVRSPYKTARLVEQIAAEYAYVKSVSAVPDSSEIDTELNLVVNGVFFVGAA